GIPIAVGAALAQRLTGSGKVVVSFFGDGAANEGAFHEAVNLAAIWKLPVVFVCENNKYGMSFSTEKSFAIENISERALGYGIPGVTVDGNDVVAVYDAVSTAVERARAGDGPTLVENLTYRWKGHSKSDKNLYRTKEEIAEWRSKDPILRFEARIRQEGLLSDEDIQHTRTQALEDMKNAVRTANAAPDADPSDLLDAVFAPA
ncbi:MAG: thiamine pyrophosphate-dependent dehydrogenase E1 component subunit alpha, partial [Nocardioides sp.]